MFFTLSKVLGFFANPSNLVVAFGIAGLVLLATRWARAGRWLVGTSFVALAVLGLSPLGNALIIPLEQRFPPWDELRGPPDGILVLGGAISPDVSLARDEVALNEFSRTAHGCCRAGTAVPQCARPVLGRDGRAPA